MTTILPQGQVGEDHKLRVAVDCDLPAGPVDVVLMLRAHDAPNTPTPSWSEIWGLGREVWQGIDANRYVSELREVREPPR